MSSMFVGVSGVSIPPVSRNTFNQPIGNWDVSSVTDMSNMFFASEFNQPIGNWDVSSVTDMSYMFAGRMYMIGSQPQFFYYHTPFDHPIDSWDVSSVTTMRGMFTYSRFEQPIGNWDVSSVTNMNSMFSFNSSFNEPIGNWDVSSVTNMAGIFFYSPFNFPLIDWCVPNLPTQPSQFVAENSTFSLANRPKWGTCPGRPAIPALNLPVNNAVDVTRNVQVTWTSSENATSYHLQIFDNTDAIVFETIIRDTFVVYPSALVANTVHKWRVKGLNDNRILGGGKPQSGSWSDNWSFVTGLTTSIAEKESPIRVELHQNYPNPFNPTTLIRFTLSTATTVKLEVFSITGQHITTLVNGWMGHGQNTVTFNAESLSSGVYVYRLITPEFTQARMMHLVK